MKLFAVRHLPTEWNREGLLQGIRDLPVSDRLDDETKRRMGALKKRLESMQFDLVLTSALSRARETGRLLGFAPALEPLLNELDFGPFEGRPKKELVAASGEAWLTDPLATPIGEFYRQLESRIRDFAHGYRDSGTVLAFTHGSWIRAAVALAESGSLGTMNSREIQNLDLVELFLDDLAVSN